MAPNTWGSVRTVGSTLSLHSPAAVLDSRAARGWCEGRGDCSEVMRVATENNPKTSITRSGEYMDIVSS